MTRLEVTEFAQIGKADIKFGELTVLVGPQASGKSLLLQWLKLAIDKNEIVSSLREAGHELKTRENLLDLTFGEGMSGAWTEGETEIRFDGKAVSPTPKSSYRKGSTRGEKSEGKVFFIPAHRALLLAEGWPAPFMKLNADTPVVARLFSQNLYQRFSGGEEKTLFPVQRILKDSYRNLVDQAVYHGGEVHLGKEGLRYRLDLTYDGNPLPFMTWTAGQREFTPLLLGLYHVLPPRSKKKRDEIDWVVIEEPEMGLHPQAITVVMLLVLELLWRGYKVVLSTHSPLVLDIVWAIGQLRNNKAKWSDLAEAFNVSSDPTLKPVLEFALKQSNNRVYFMEIEKESSKANTVDISELNPDSESSSEADWGGLTGFNSRFGDVVRRSANEDSE